MGERDSSWGRGRRRDQTVSIDLGTTSPIVPWRPYPLFNHFTQLTKRTPRALLPPIRVEVERQPLLAFRYIHYVLVCRKKESLVVVNLDQVRKRIKCALGDFVEYYSLTTGERRVALVVGVIRDALRCIDSSGRVCVVDARECEFVESCTGAPEKKQKSKGTTAAGTIAAPVMHSEPVETVVSFDILASHERVDSLTNTSPIANALGVCGAKSKLEGVSPGQTVGESPPSRAPVEKPRTWSVPLDTEPAADPRGIVGRCPGFGGLGEPGASRRWSRGSEISIDRRGHRAVKRAEHGNKGILFE
jgi:hypothetical protein